MRCDLPHTGRPVFAGELKDEQFNIILRMIISGDFSQDFGLDPSFWIEHRDETKGGGHLS
jgi:hypothetical protein